MPTVNINVNGQDLSAEVEERQLLVHFLRDDMDLTGTHVGCDTSQCGACVVHLEGKAVKSCTMLAVQANGKNITTIEGIADGDNLHPVQEAFRDHHGLQCGFCTPGMIMAAIDIINRKPNLDEKIVREELEEIGKLQQEIYGNVINFPTMSRQEQLEHVDKLTELLDKQKIMYARLSLSDDPEAIELLNSMKYSFQVMGFPTNMNVNQFFDEAKKTIETLRVSIDK